VTEDDDGEDRMSEKTWRLKIQWWRQRFDRSASDMRQRGRGEVLCTLAA
jgi:hypothetical protein